MNANDLYLITLEKAITVDKVVTCCHDSALSGEGSCPFLNHYFSTEIISDLGNLGFRVKESVSPIGEKIYIVSWV